VVVLGLAASSLVFGMNLMPSSESMMQKLGTLAPWRITWALIWITALTGFVLSAFLFAAAAGKMRKSS
jgi:hypothetical protein